MRRISISSSFALTFFVLAGCAADATSGSTAAGTETDTSAAELEAAQCSFEAYEGVAGACKTDFEACLEGQNDPEACRKTLEACLPAPPFGGPPGPKGGEGGKGPGCDDPNAPGKPGEGPRPPQPSGEGPKPPEPPQPPKPPKEGEAGGAPPPKPPEGGGLPPVPGKPPHGGPLGHPAPAEVVACHDALRVCLDAEGGGPGEAAKGCFDTAHECVKTAVAQVFEARCAEVSANCAAGKVPEAACAKILARCDAGVAPRPDAPPDVRCASK